ncbi:MAG: DUF1080 domain-containing protein [Planctomycetes bacterium]|nr:DUF1080 domain-containing protein [Planctomycetota bacterium]
MRRLVTGVSTCLTIGLLAAAAAGAEGYSYPIFDGASLAGWTIENDCEVEVQDGALLLKTGNGWLRSDHTFGDFTLHLEWKAFQESGFDAGIYIRTLPGGEPFPKRGYQINLLEGRVGHIGNLPGAVTEGLVHPPGKWNVFEITVAGDSVSLAINGKEAYTVGGIEIPRGHVGLQVEVPKGGQFLVRNIRITERDHESLFDGRTLAHWEGAGQPAETCWAVEDGLLKCLKKKGPWLRSEKQYGDFNLRLEYRLNEGGNSGVYVRVPENGNHHRDNELEPPAGFEVQILDDGAAAHRKLKDYQYSASVYDIAGVEERVSKPPGEWNTLEINCKGHQVTTRHNGVAVVQVSPETHPAIELRKLEGFLGLQNHGGGVDFRNLRIGPAIEEPVAAAPE